MFNILGFILVVLVAGYCSVAYLLLFANGMGTYNIGGVPNSVRGKAGIVILGLLLGRFWYWIIQHAPFTITVSQG